MKNIDKKNPEGSLNETPRSKKFKQPGLMSLAARMLINKYDETKSSISSPSSLYLALETLARGAEGETLAEIETVLGGSDDRNKTCTMLFKKTPASHQTITYWTSPPLFGQTKTQLRCCQIIPGKLLISTEKRSN